MTLVGLLVSYQYQLTLYIVLMYKLSQQINYIPSMSEMDNATWREVINATPMRTNQQYVFYYRGIAKILVLGILPLSSLVYLNLKIYKAVKAPLTVLDEDDKGAQRHERELAKVLIGVVVIFIVCNTFRVIIEIDNMIGSKIVEECYKAGKHYFHLWSIIVDPLSEFMMVFNSSINTVIYGYLNKKFRTHFTPCIQKSDKNFVLVEIRLVEINAEEPQLVELQVPIED